MIIKDSAIAYKMLTFVKSPGFRRYFVNTSWLFIDKIVVMAIAFLVGLYVARYFGPKDFGIFNFARSIAMFFTVFTSLGLESILTRNLVNTQHQEEQLLGTAFFMRFFAALLSSLGILLCWLWFPSTNVYMPLIFIFVASSFFQAVTVIRQFYESRVQSKFVAYISVGQTLLIALVKIILVYINASLVWFAVAISFESVLMAMGLIFVYQKKEKCFQKWRFNKQLGLLLLKDSWPLILSSFLIFIYMKTDQIMIMYLLDEVAVGHYAAASKLTEIWYFLGMILCRSLFPAIINAKKNNEKQYRLRVQRLLDLMMILATLVALPVSFFSREIVFYLYGEAFLPASEVVQIHVWSLVFVFLGMAGSRWLLAENLQKVTLVRTVIGAIVNVALNFLLIPLWGIYGAAIATLIAQLISSYVSYVFSPLTRQVFIMQTKAIFLVNPLKATYHFCIK